MTGQQLHELSVPHLDEIGDITELQAHYAHVERAYITAGGQGFIVRMPEQKRIHFYEYDDWFPKVNPKLRRRATKPYVFAGEGYYDEHSPLWLQPQRAGVSKEVEREHFDRSTLPDPFDGGPL